jgi:hypothetical protein
MRAGEPGRTLDSMTESSSVRRPLMVVGPVMPDDRPFRVVEIRGGTDREVVAKAHSLVDLIFFAHSEGLEHIDLDDPSKVRWIGGGQYHWS